jgi:putrescine aminotransferase
MPLPHNGGGSACVNHGLVVRATGDRMLLSPPLVLSRENIDEIVSKLRNALDHLVATMAD